jgi:hypothetical protein
MKTSIWITLVSFLSIAGCAPANISSHLRAPTDAETSMQTRCVDFITGKDLEVNSELSQYDGWKIVYASEYTTGNKTTTSMVICFEKPYSK